MSVEEVARELIKKIPGIAADAAYWLARLERRVSEAERKIERLEQEIAALQSLVENQPPTTRES